MAANLGDRRGGTTLGAGGVRCTVVGAVIGRDDRVNTTLGDVFTLGVGGVMLSDGVVLWCWRRKYVGFFSAFGHVTIRPLELTRVWRRGDCHGRKSVGWVLDVMTFVFSASCVAFA